MTTTRPEATWPPTPPHRTDKLPEAAYLGLVGDYVDAISGTTEAPYEFHAGAFLTVTGLLFADATLIEGRLSHSPRFYSLLVGPTGITKSTVRYYATDLLKMVAPDFPVISAEGSRQGLILRLIAASTQQTESYSDPEIQRFAQAYAGRQVPAALGSPALLEGGEFTKALKQMTRNGTSDLAEFYIDAYDGKKLETSTLSNPALLLRPKVSVLGDSTGEGLADLMTDSTIKSGFFNRFSIWTGVDRGVPYARPGSTVDGLGPIADALRTLRGDLGSDPTMAWSPEGGTFYDHLYDSVLFPRKKSDDGPVLTREADHVKRLAMVFALLRGSLLIDTRDVFQAWETQRYLSTSALSLAGKIVAGPRSELLDYVEGRIKAAGANGIKAKPDPTKPDRPSVGYLHSQISPTKRPAIDETFRLGLIECVTYLLTNGRIRWVDQTLIHPEARI